MRSGRVGGMSAEVTLNCVCCQGVQQSPAVLAAGQDSDGEHEGYIGRGGIFTPPLTLSTFESNQTKDNDLYTASIGSS